MSMFDFNWDEVTESTGGGNKLPAGGYVVKVISYKLNQEKKNICLYMDVTEGEHKGHGEGVEASTGQDYGYIKGYLSWRTTGGRGIMKHALKLMGSKVCEEVMRENLSALTGATVGVVLGEKEYKKQDGSIGVTLSLPEWKPIEDIRAGKFAVPPLKKLKEESAMGETEPDDGKIPF